MTPRFELYTSFGPRIAFFRAIDTLSRHIPGRSLDKRFSEEVERYLEQVINVADGTMHPGQSVQKIGDSSPIWTMWWQGEDKMPPLVSACIHSVKKNAGSHPVIVLDQNNWTRYITLDPAQLNAFQTGKITITHLSDLFRVELLKKYGGIWMDSTLYMTESFDPCLAAYPLWTTHIRQVPTGIQWSDNWSKLWSGYFIASGADSPLFIYLSDALKQYWRKYDCLIDYLLLDRFINMATRHYPFIKHELENVPINNEGILAMQPALDKPASDWTPPENTWLYKLSWKAAYPATQAGEDTLLAHL